MNSIILVALALVAVAVAVPVDVVEPVKILEQVADQKPDGSYVNSFKTEDGISRQEEGQLKEVRDEDNKPVNVLTVRGFYSYNDPEGKPNTVNYYADETGFHAEGDSIPKAVRR